MRMATRLLVAVTFLGVGLAGATDVSADDVDEARARAEATIRALDEAQEELGAVEQRVAEVQHRLEVASADIEQLEAEVQAIAVDQYMRAGEPPSLVPVDEDLGDQLLGNELARIVTQGDTDAIDAYAAQRADLATAADELEALQAEQEDAVAQLESRNRELQAEVERLEALERERIEAERRRIEEERRRREAQEQAAAAAAAAATTPDDTTPTTGGGGGGGTPPPTGGGGDFLCPVPGSTFTDSWGAPRSGGRSHQGVDMMASAGTPIYAPVTGDVSHRGVSLGGLSFFLYGDNGNTYFGTHLSSYGASGRVVAGTVIGYVGATGNANGINHLHFEIWPGGGAPVNPYPTVAAAC
ncbi:MAG: peptidoglycan DD-metalloendopeptidase family protein [Acidimicrobiales bacterium]|nr:peptidoglycan DD-metalloendopeptidase family protein [Acidimicrobiales bacterium]